MPGGDSKPEKAPWRIWPRQVLEALYAQSRRLNCTLLIPDDFLLRRSFYLRDQNSDKNRSIIISSRLAIYLLKKWPRTIFNQCCRYEKPVVDNLSSYRDQSILGYFQSYKYFEEFGDDVKNQFEFLDPIKLLAEQAIDSALKTTELTLKFIN
uniref:Uncharacterized protein n=1 Tax=Romanomermis culicivorax TaxID=13658 RepID=A0A915IHD7_ROMCU